jgi:sugar phosphate isomerase/epimerase
MKSAIQLYSLRQIIQNGDDLLATFPRLKEIGYDGVEFAGYQGLPAETIRKALDDAGLLCAGTHMGLGDLKPENLPATIAYCKTLGMTHIGIGGADHGTPERTAASCTVLKQASETAAKEGITIYYHNHSEEFRPFPDGTLSIDQFLQACALQLDTYWSFVGGADTPKFLKDHAKQIWTVHLKDGTGKEGRQLGEGVNNLTAVIQACKENGYEWVIVEDEDHADEEGVWRDITTDINWIQANV